MNAEKRSKKELEGVEFKIIDIKHPAHVLRRCIKSRKLLFREWGNGNVYVHFDGAHSFYL